MALGDRHYTYMKASFGLFQSKNEKDIFKLYWGYTDYHKQVKAASTTAVHAAANTALTSQTLTAGITNPDVPRVLSVTVGGTGSSVLDSQIVVTGTNVEGKVITDTFQTTATSTGTLNGNKAFKTVTSIFIPAQAGTAATVAVGYLNKLGLNHRLQPNQYVIRVIRDTDNAGIALDSHVFDSQPTVNANEKLVEFNWAQPSTAPTGAVSYRVAYANFEWSLDKQEAKEPRFTSTSTSTSSTSTSTTTTPTTSTSTSSTSVSSTSSSTSSTSTSTSSTSTSTSTLP